MFGIFHLGASGDDTCVLAAVLEAIDSVGGVVQLVAMDLARLGAGVMYGWLLLLLVIRWPDVSGQQLYRLTGGLFTRLTGLLCSTVVLVAGFSGLFVVLFTELTWQRNCFLLLFLTWQRNCFFMLFLTWQRNCFLMLFLTWQKNWFFMLFLTWQRNYCRPSEWGWIE